MMDFALKMMDFAFKMMDFVLPGEADYFEELPLSHKMQHQQPNKRPAATWRQAPAPVRTAARPSSRRVVVDDAVGRNALIEGTHTIVVTSAGGNLTSAGYLQGRPWPSFGLKVSKERVVTEVVPGGPAEAAGLQVGSEIVKVNGVAVGSKGEFGEQAKLALTTGKVAFTCKNIIHEPAAKERSPTTFRLHSKERSPVTVQ